jgi:hypothetical protein
MDKYSLYIGAVWSLVQSLAMELGRRDSSFPASSILYCYLTTQESKRQ